MSYIPTLKTPVFDRRTRAPTSGRVGTRTRPPVINKVRFDTNDRDRTSISLTQRERERRKNDALNFLRKETSESNNRQSDRLGVGASHSSYIPDSNSNSNSNSNFNHQSHPRFKTFELLNDEPISRLNQYSANSILNDEDRIKGNFKFENVKKSKFDPFGYERRSRVSGVNSRVSKQKNNRNDSGLLNSISNFGSKIINSILYNEEDTSIRNIDNVPVVTKNLHDELDLKLMEKKFYLDKLNKEIERKEIEMKRLNDANNNSAIIHEANNEKTINDLNLRIDNLISEFKLNSNINYLNELNSLKDDLKILKRLQDSNTFKINNKFQDFRIENQLNFEKLLKTVKNVENTKIIDSESIPKSRSRMGSLSSSASERIESDDSIDSIDSDDKDILNHIMKNKRSKNVGATNSKLRNKIRKIKSNLRRIENVTSK